MSSMKDRPAVYIAGPYSSSPYSSDPVKGTRDAVFAADRVWEAGGSPYVPHLTHLWHLISPKPYSTWLELDMHWVARCDVLCRIPGESSGADKEVSFAQGEGIPVYYGVTACLGYLQEHTAGIDNRHDKTCKELCEWCKKGWPVQRAVQNSPGWIHFRPEEEESPYESPLKWEICRASLLHEYRRKLMGDKPC